jgi:hypothetical protein
MVGTTTSNPGQAHLREQSRAREKIGLTPGLGYSAGRSLSTRVVRDGQLHRPRYAGRG